MKIDIDNPESLLKGSTGVTERIIDYCLEAAVLCLQRQGHSSPKKGEITGDWNEVMSISWEHRNQKDLEISWDIFDAIEQGATAIALLLVDYKNYRVVERAQRRLPGGGASGFDYWLENMNSENLSGFKNKMKLEISGILKGTEVEINRRVKEKIEQVSVSDHLDAGAIILVVEFGNPKVQMCQRLK